MSSYVSGALAWVMAGFVLALALRGLSTTNTHSPAPSLTALHLLLCCSVCGCLCVHMHTGKVDNSGNLVFAELSGRIGWLRPTGELVG